jgi:DNA polymerase-3 subunit alpha
VKTHCGKSTAEYLTMAGAFEKFAPNRKALYDVLPEYLEFDKKVKAKEKKIEEFEMKLSDETIKEKDKEKYEKSLESYKKSLQDLISSINALSFDKTEESVIQKLDYEKIALGAPVSASYLDGYSTPEENDCIPLAFIKEGTKSTVMGFVSDLRITKKKSNNKDMAFFMIEDQTGIIKASVFDVSYSKFGSLIKENVVLKITGNIKKDTYNDTDFYNIVADKIEVVEPNKKPVIIYVEDEFEWVNKILPILPLYRDKVGHKVKIFDISEGLYKTSLFAIKDSEKETYGDKELTVSLDILDDKRIKTHY